MRRLLLVMLVVTGLSLFAHQADATEIKCKGTVKSVDFDKNVIVFLPDCASEPITIDLGKEKSHVLMEGDTILVTYEKDKANTCTHLQKLRHGFNPANPPECCLGDNPPPAK